MPLVEKAFCETLSIICEIADVSVGHVYRLTPHGILVPSQLWYEDHPHRYDVLKRITTLTSFVIGQGLPGHVLQPHKQVKMSNLEKNDNFLRSDAASAVGLVNAVAFPVCVDHVVMAIVECFFKDLFPDRELLNLMDDIAGLAKLFSAS